MKTSKSKVILLIAFFASAFVHADTVAWYRFDEAPVGTVTDGSAAFLNAVDPSKHAGYFRSWTRGSRTPIISDGAGDYYPQYTNGFGNAVKVFDPVGGTIYDNDAAMLIRSADMAQATSASGLLVVDDHEDLHLQSFTLEFILRMPAGSAQNNAMRILAKKVSSNDAGCLFQLYLHNTSHKLMAGFYPAGSTGSVQIAGPRVADGLLHRVAFVVDDDSKTVKLYVDNSEYSGSFTDYADYSGAGVLCVGAPYNMNTGTWEGTIDEVRLSDRALSVTELLRPYCRVSSDSAATTADTLVYMDSEGSAETPDYSEFASAIRPPENAEAVGNKAPWNPSFTEVPYVKTSASTTDPAFVQEDDVPAGIVRSYIGGASSSLNESSLHFVTNDVASARPACIFVPDPDRTIFSGSVTVEFAFKLMPGMIPFTSSSTRSMLSSCQGCYSMRFWNGNSASKDDGRIDFLNGTNVNVPVTVRGSGIGSVYTSEHYNDGLWHTVAVVYDHDAATGKFYIDGELRASASDYALAAQTSSEQGLSFAGDGDFRNISLDNIRITRGALRPYQFLTAIPVEENLLGRASFENDLVMTPYTNFFGEAGTVSAFTAGGSVPSFSTDVPAKTIAAGRGGEIIVEVNRKSLSLDGGKAVWSGRELLADTDEFTVEFFMKSSGAVADAGVMRVNRGSTTDVTSAVTWALSFADASGNLRLKVDTDEATDQTHDFASAFADGAWHHVGITFAVSGGNTVATLYKDAELVESWTADGKILTSPGDMNFMIGAGEDAAAGFVGLVDELRVTPGQVDPSDFLTPVRNGFCIIFQ